MLNLPENSKEWLTENILGWKRSIVCGYDFAKEGTDTSVQYAVWITEQGTHQYLPNFEDALMVNKLLECLKEKGYTVRIETFLLPHTNQMWWECTIFSGINIGVAQERDISHAIIKASLQLKNND